MEIPIEEIKKLSHDINNHVCVVGGFLELLEGPITEELFKGYLSKATNHMDNLRDTAISLTKLLEKI